MKHVLFLTLFLSFSIPLFAQYEYQSFPTDTASWTHRETIGVGPYDYETSDFQYRLYGNDTIIDNKTYKQLHYIRRVVSGNNPPLDSVICATHEEVYQGVIREEGKRIYVRGVDIGCMGDGVLYDFNLEVGDPTPPCYFFSGTIVAIDTVEIMGHLRKRFTIETVHPDPHYIYEGIGSSLGLRPAAPHPNNVDLICFEKFDNLLYQSPDFEFCPDIIECVVSSQEQDLPSTIKISPNPASNSLSIKSETEAFNARLSIFSASGKQVLHQINYNQNNTINIESLPAGIYLISLRTDKEIWTGRFVKVE